jgi:hypothetical protein
MDKHDTKDANVADLITRRGPFTNSLRQTCANCEAPVFETSSGESRTELQGQNLNHLVAQYFEMDHHLSYGEGPAIVRWCPIRAGS